MLRAASSASSYVVFLPVYAVLLLPVCVALLLVCRIPPPCVRRAPPCMSCPSSLCASRPSSLCASCALHGPCLCFSYTLNSVPSQTSGRLSPPFFPPCSLHSNIPLSHTVIPSLARQSQGASPPNSGLRFHSELLSSQNLLLFETVLFTH